MKTIKLKSNGVGRYEDVSPCIIIDRKLALKIALPPVNGDFYLVTENNGAIQKRLLSKSGETELENLSAGELNAEVKHYLKGSLIKVYKIEPLLLKEADGEVSVLPEIAALDLRICAVQRNLEGAKKTAEEHAEKHNKRLLCANKNIAALIRFAFKAYNASPFLGGGTVDKFAKDFGLELTEEEINLINGGNQNA